MYCLLFTPDAMARYEALFTYLLSVQRAMLALQSVWQHLMTQCVPSSHIVFKIESVLLKDTYVHTSVNQLYILCGVCLNPSWVFRKAYRCPKNRGARLTNKFRADRNLRNGREGAYRQYSYKPARYDSEWRTSWRICSSISRQTWSNHTTQSSQQHWIAAGLLGRFAKRTMLF